jgi:hypothetical protein
MSRSVPVQCCGRMNSRALRFSQGVSARARYRRLRIETGGDANDAHGDDATGRLSYDCRRSAAAGIATKVGNHSFRATGITAYLKNMSQQPRKGRCDGEPRQHTHHAAL